MNSSAPVTTTFEKIRKGLDSAFGYIIFENKSEFGNFDDFRDVTAIISHCKEGIIKQTFYRDKITKRLLLLIKLESDQADTVRQMILDIKLPKDITVYFYYIS